MVRAPFFDKNGVKRGAWSQEEDDKLRAYVLKYGHWNWRELPKFAGLSRCGKSCRLRWMNYLRPGVKHGDFSQEEEGLITELHKKFGNKWSKIAASLPGRTDNEIKNYWHTHLKKQTRRKETSSGFEQKTSSKYHQINQATTTDLRFIFESRPLSPESSNSTEFSDSTCDSAMVTASSISSNWNNNVAEDYQNNVFETYGNWSGDFWTQPFVAEKDAYRSPLKEEGLLSSYFTCYDDSVDLFYQVMKELRGN